MANLLYAAGAGRKRKTRSEDCPIIGGNLEALSHSFLPSKSDVIRNINHRRDLIYKSRLEKSEWSSIFSEVKTELNIIWSKANIPICDEKNLDYHLRKLYEKDYSEMKKSLAYYEKDEEKKKIWLEKNDFSPCFDVTACSHFKKATSKEEILSSSSNCDCVSGMKIPEEELEFYASQKFDRGADAMLVISSEIDMKTSQKNSRKKPRLSISPTQQQPSSSQSFDYDSQL